MSGPPPDPTVAGGGGGGGQGISAGIGGSATSPAIAGANGKWWTYGAGGTSSRGATGGNGGSLQTAGSAGNVVPGPVLRDSNTGGAAGSTGSAGTQGDRGPAILGNTNIVFTSNGTITGNSISNTSYIPRVTAVDFFGGQANTSGSTCSFPAGIQTGDVAVFFTSVISVSPPSKIVPSGFNEISDTSLDVPSSIVFDCRSTISYKVLSGTETSVNGYTSGYSTLLVFRSNNPQSSVSIHDAKEQSTLATPDVQVITLAADTPPILAIAHYCTSLTGTYTSNTTMLEFLNSVQCVKVKRFISGDTLENILISMNDGGTNVLQTFYVKFT